MAVNLTAVESVCEMGRAEQILLTSREKPIVILAKKQFIPLQGYRVSELVAPHLDTLGVMLPYTPLHHLLLNQTDPILAREPVPPILVMTSSNFSEEPIATDNKDALRRLSPLADAFLLHNREIHTRSDDSVAKVDQGNTVYRCRSRGYAPYPVTLPFESRPTLAVGSERRNTFCLTRERHAFFSHHIGDMGNVETQVSFVQALEHLSHLFHVQPEIIAHDLHPDYFTTQYASHSNTQRVGVQHHHAHIVSCMVDNGLSDRELIGLAFDGAGYGVDDMTWGGEILIASFADFERFAHLEYLPFPGAEAIRAPWRVAAGYAHTLGIGVDHLPFLQNVDKQALRLLRQQIDKEVNSPLTSSMGHLFDAVASLIGVRNDVTYEAQAAIEMEVLSKPFIAAAQSYPCVVDERETKKTIRVHELFQSIVEDVRAGESIGRIGANFHKTIAGIAIEICRRARSEKGLNEVALSGGVWHNQVLLDLVRDGLSQDGFTVYFHKHVPANNGGLALGQAVIANHIHAARSESVGERSRCGS